MLDNHKSNFIINVIIMKIEKKIRKVIMGNTAFGVSLRVVWVSEMEIN